MPKPFAIFVALSLALALFIAGCGGSDDSISKAEFTKRANAICIKVSEAQYNGSNAYARKNQKKLAALKTKAFQEEIYTAVALPLIPKEVQELEALGAPDGDEETIETMLDEVEKGVEEAEKEPDFVTGGIDDPFKDPNIVARKYGIRSCAFG